MNGIGIEFYGSLEQLKLNASKLSHTHLNDYLNSFQTSVDLIPFIIRNLLIKLETDRTIAESNYNYGMDFILDVTDQKSYFGRKVTGGNLEGYLFPRLDNEEVFFKVLSNWQSKEVKYVSRTMSAKKHAHFNIEREIDYKKPKNRIFSIIKFEPEINNLPLDAVDSLNNLITLFVNYIKWLLKGVFDIVQKNKVLIIKKQNKLHYELIDNKDYKFPWECSENEEHVLRNL